MNDFIDANNSVGCAVGIVCNNQVHYLKAYGLSRQNDADTAFQYYTPSSVGSISKTLTALAILVLHEREKIDLQQTINAYLPFCPVAWRDITVLELLSHSSGLPREPSMNFPSTEADLISKFPDDGDHPGIFPRNAYFGYRSTEKQTASGTSSYSNAGYTILGAIIDFMTTNPANDFAPVERGYENFVWWNVCMKGGTISGDTMLSPCLNAYWRQADIPNLAFDQPGNAESFVNRRYTGWEGPAGGWTMTIGDLARLMIMINTNQIISEETRQLMMDNYGVTGTSALGLGVFRPTAGSQAAEYFGAPAFFHSGRIGNYDARYTMWNESGFGIALLFNSRTESSAIKQLTLNLAGHFIGNRFTSLCNANDIVLSTSDAQKVGTQLYHFSKHHQRDVVRIVELYQHRYGSLERGVGALLKNLGDNSGPKLLDHLLKGEFEVVARYANRLFRERLMTPPTNAHTLPDYDIE
ncbi:serine hydrolase domain-containing protein [Neolewinella xylanilytica]|nr:serine hydrolase domain-containing protein [Neolewinella xylanilytica]